MKSWISKALLGLCLAAPSAMAILPKLPGQYAGIYMDVSGFNSTQVAAMKNGMGLWLLGMRSTFNSTSTKFRVVAYPEAPNTVATVTIEKVNAPTSKCAAGADPRLCAFDISYSYRGTLVNYSATYDNVAIKIYTQNAQGGSIGLPLGNSTDDQISFQNFATYLSRLVLDPLHTLNPNPAAFFDEESNPKEVIVPAGACGIEYYYHGSTGVCGVSWANPYNLDGLRPIIVFKKINSAGTVVGYISKLDLPGVLPGSGSPGPGYILASARYAFSETPAGGKSVTGWQDEPQSISRLVVGTNTGSDAPCYSTGAASVGWDYGYSVSANPTTGPLAAAVNAGLNLSNITRVSLPIGDAISGTYPQSCQTVIGFVGDFLLGN
jgi:hypothetical protein